MIRKVTERDREIYLALAKEFYSSPAVSHTLPDEHFSRTFDEAMRSDDYVGLFMLIADGEVCGYAATAKTFTQEAGGTVIWLEELYVRPAFRSHGLGREFFAFMERELPAARYRLEVESGNERAKALYARLGYKQMPYEQMYKE